MKKLISHYDFAQGLPMAVTGFMVLCAATARIDAEPVDFQEQIIEHEETAPDDPWTKSYGDLNGDGTSDLIIGGHGGGGLVWYEGPSWDKHSIASGDGFGTDGEVADIDRDGDSDVAVIRDSTLIWYENEDGDGSSWARHEIDGDRRLHDIELVDFDDDGDVDVVGRNQSAFGGDGNRIHFYEYDGPKKPWGHREIQCPHGEGLAVGDLDGDNDLDVVVNQYWYENDGEVLDGKWTRHQYSETWAHPHVYVALADFNGDGRLDIVLTPSEREGTYRIAWFEAPEDSKSTWKEHLIEKDVEAIHHFVGIGDFNDDGAVDVATAEMSQSNGDDNVKIYYNKNRGASWNKQILSNSGSHSMRVLDADDDGDLDLFGANWRGNGRHEHIKLWENLARRLP